MTKHIDSGRSCTVADEIIDNAAGLPLENQELLLMMAKAMQYTRSCIIPSGTLPPSSLAPDTDT